MPEISGMIQQFLEGNIKTLSGSEPVIESKTITENGTYTAPEGVDGYSPVVVNVPSDEPVIESKTLTENGTYTPESGVDGFAPVVVNVPPTEPIIESKNITENGTYTAPEGVDGYSPVVVNVPQTTLTTLDVTENGTYTAPSGTAYDEVDVNVPLPTNVYLLKSVNTPTPIASFDDGEEMVMPSLKVAIEPQQDLHGYDAPWVGGAGKNKFDIDATHTTGTGTYIYEVYVKPNTPFTLSSNCPSLSPANLYFNGGSTETNGVGIGHPKTFNSGEDGKFTIYVRSLASGTAIDLYSAVKNGQYYIQLEEGSTATSYAPYSNICPISGWDDVDLTVADATTDPTVENIYTIDLDGTRYGGKLDVVNGIVTPAPYYASYNGETLTGEWISDRDKYEVGATPTIGAQVVNIGASGTPVSILPTAIKSLRGVNNVWADTGDIKDAEYFSKEV